MKNLNPFGYIYLITNLINAKVYVGKSESTIKERWYTHKWRTTHLNKVDYPIAIDLAINKYGESNFKIEELEKVYGTFNHKILLKKSLKIKFALYSFNTN